MTRMLAPASSRCVAKQWRKVLTVTCFVSPAARAACRQARPHRRGADRLVWLARGEEPRGWPCRLPVET